MSGTVRDIEDLLRAAVKSRRVPGVVAAVADRSGVLDEWAFGLAGSSPAREMHVDSIFRIASMTKVVTSVAVLMLSEHGELDLDAPLARYLPGYRQPDVLTSFDTRTNEYQTRPAKSAITIRQLLTHTSGYGYWFLDESLRKLTKEVPELFNPPFLIAEPGQGFAYGTSTDVLGQVIPELTGQSLDEFFAQHIFEPLGMSDTSYRWPEALPRMTSVHARTTDGYVELPLEQRNVEARGGGGLFSTARDFLRLLEVFMHGGRAQGRPILSAASVAAMTRNQIGELFAPPQTTALPTRSNDFIFMDGSQKFGLGFMLETREQATGRRAGTLSWGGILNTYFWLDPSAALAGVLFTQISPFADPDCIDLYRRFERAVYDRIRPPRASTPVVAARSGRFGR